MSVFYYDSFDKAISDLIEVDIQDYLKAMNKLRTEDFDKWKGIIDSAKSGSIDELRYAKIEIESICSEQS